MVQARNVPKHTQLFLYVHAGGRCEFDGCNQYLLEHHVTKTEGNFAEMAHIYAFAEGGPRADEPGRGKDKHALDNLMLLCPACHKLVDDKPKQWTVSVLKAFKKAHEERVFMLTDTRPDSQTAAVVLRGRVAGKIVTVTLGEIQEAVAPRYLGKRDILDIDLTAIQDSVSQDFWNQASAAICTRMRTFYETPLDSGVPRHVSVFALAPIPLLMVLGRCLSDKVPTALYQRHRDTENWKWKTKEQALTFQTTRLREGRDPSRAALLVSASGIVTVEDLPKEIDRRYSVYAITPANATPAPTILRTMESLQEFRGEYQRAIRRIVDERPKAASIDVFPAVPAPVAVAMGRDLLPKRDPVLSVYDFNKSHGGFAKALEINQS